jgi:hypothetical protein
MNELILVAGVGVSCFLLLYLAFRCLDKEHVLWRLLTVFFVLFMITIIGKIGHDSGTYCQLYVENTTVVGDTTTLGYAEHCFTENSLTYLTFFKVTQWIIRAFAAYIFIYYSYIGAQYLMQQAKIKKGGGGSS